MNTALNHLSNKYIVTQGSSPSAILVNKVSTNKNTTAQKIEDILFGFSPDKFTFIYRMQQYGRLLNSIPFSKQFVEEVDPVINYLTDRTWFDYDYKLTNYNIDDNPSVDYTFEFKPDFRQDDVRGVNLLNTLVNLYISETSLVLELRDLNNVNKSKFYTGAPSTSLETDVKDLGKARVLYGAYGLFSHWKEEHWSDDAWLNHWLEESYDEVFSWHVYKLFRPQRTIKEINSTLKAEVDLESLTVNGKQIDADIKNMANHSNAMYSTAGYCCALIQSNLQSV